MNSLKKRVLVAAAIGVLALALRMPGLGQIMTVDESTWMDRSRLMINNTLNWNLVDTFLSTHPGATTMWLVGGGIKFQESRLGQELSGDNTIHFRKAAVFPVVLATSLLIALITYLLIPLFNKGTAITAGVLLAADPYLTGMSQIAHLDALQALLMLSSLLAFLLSLKQKTNPTKLLILAGVMGGLAAANRLVFVIPLLLGMLGILVLRRYAWQQILRKMALVITPTILLFYALWPAMWFYDDVARSFVRDTSQVVTDEHVQLTNTAEESISPKSFYLRTWLGRVPPHIQVLSIVAIIMLSFDSKLSRFPRESQRDSLRVSSSARPATQDTMPAPSSNPLESSTNRQHLFYLALYALGFLILITFAAKKADRYAMPALVVFPVLSAWVANIAAGYILPRLKSLNMSRALVTLTGLAVVGLPLLWSPHAIAYNNPIFPSIRPLSQQGWGEGLEAAASWLNEQPNSEHLTVASWYDDVARTYFDGKIFRLGARTDYRVSHLITYRNMHGRENDSIASDVLDEMDSFTPVHIVEIQGKPYAWVYNIGGVGEFTRTLGELLPEKEFGQVIIPDADSFNSVSFGLATFGGRAKTGSVTLHIRESVDSERDLESVTIPVATIEDNAWHRFDFRNITGAKGKEYYIFLSSNSSSPENAITVRYTDVDLLPGQLIVDGQVKTGDLAYKIN